MIDIHSHILPELDDGARSMEEALEMAAIAAGDGITHIVATPHMYNGLSTNPDPSDVAGRVDALQREIGDPLRVLPGNEVHVAHDTAEKFAEGRLTPLNNGNYVLIEFPSMAVPTGVDQVFYKLLVHGVTPILVHPERNLRIQQAPEIAARFVECGVRVQVTAMSVTGEFGVSARQAAEWLLRHNSVHFLATDTHRAHQRPPILSRGREAAGRIIGPEAATRLVEDNPRAAIEGRPFDPGPPVPFTRFTARPGLMSRFFQRR
jgi:protein-tyrosine phosphatase